MNSSVNVRDWTIFFEQVRSRCEKLIDVGIWEGITKDRLHNWLGRFDGGTESFLAACLLDSLTYRSREQFRSMLTHVFTATGLHKGKEASDNELVSQLASRSDPGVRVVPAIKLSAPPTKSGPYVLRVAQRIFGFADNWLMWPQALSTLPQHVNLLIFIDDFCGTGDQFCKFLREVGVDKLHQQRPKLKVTYLVATAHEQGISKIGKEYPFIDIYCADQLTAQHNFLSPEWLARLGAPDAHGAILLSYQEVLEKAQLPQTGGIGKTGYGSLGLCYAFAHGTPNNTLPIFWCETNHWHPLLDR